MYPEEMSPVACSFRGPSPWPVGPAALGSALWREDTAEPSFSPHGLQEVKRKSKRPGPTSPPRAPDAHSGFARSATAGARLDAQAFGQHSRSNHAKRRSGESVARWALRWSPSCPGGGPERAQTLTAFAPLNELNSGCAVGRTLR